MRPLILYFKNSDSRKLKNEHRKFIDAKYNQSFAPNKFFERKPFFITQTNAVCWYRLGDC